MRPRTVDAVDLIYALILALVLGAVLYMLGGSVATVGFTVGVALGLFIVLQAGGERR